MNLTVERSILRGQAAIPASKSHTIRAVAIASLADGTSTIRNPLISSDTLSAVSCYRAFGAIIDTSSNSLWTVKGVGSSPKPPSSSIDSGNSGTTIRIAAASAALANSAEAIILTGDEQIQSRPIGPLLESLNHLGAKAVSVNGNGKPPIAISGGIIGGKTSIKCITSQYLSSILLAAPLAPGDTEIEVTLLNEPDYVQMTLDWLDRQQIEYENHQMKYFKIPGKQKFKAFDETIAADFSSATFFLCAGAVANADITVTGLDFNDSQPDKAVVNYLKAMGANVEICGNQARIKTSRLSGTEIDMNRTPDALPAMAVTAAFAEGETRLINVAQARNKETDRIACMATELKKIDICVEELPDGLIIRGGKIKSENFCGYDDHRIVMALSLIGLCADGVTSIDTAEAMNVTFPQYVTLMNSIGAKMSINQ
ncbi:MAG: 3-phosphoshikimate 1-carboxyvinyltransferase [Anaerohalosphaera sp.]|nr:3-phosphoshikimate 1-carboxyvinyltransferase [Anaerohalosphaera sp.]